LTPIDPTRPLDARRTERLLMKCNGQSLVVFADASSALADAF